MGCTCKTCSICGGLGTVRVPSCSDIYDLEQCDNCDRGIVEECDFCADARERDEDERGEAMWGGYPLTWGDEG